MDTLSVAPGPDTGNQSQGVSGTQVPVFDILSGTDRDDILRYLPELRAFDRRLRFCSAVPDTAIVDYVARLDSARELALGAREEGKLAALVHLGALSKPGEAELGISVAGAWRGRGLSVRITGEAFRSAAHCGLTHVHVYYVDENPAMRAVVGHQNPSRNHPRVRVIARYVLLGSGASRRRRQRGLHPIELRSSARTADAPAE